jgi:hypothetical protein
MCDIYPTIVVARQSMRSKGVYQPQTCQSVHGNLLRHSVHVYLPTGQMRAGTLPSKHVHPTARQLQVTNGVCVCCMPDVCIDEDALSVDMMKMP